MRHPLQGLLVNCYCNGNTWQDAAIPAGSSRFPTSWTLPFVCERPAAKLAPLIAIDLTQFSSSSFKCLFSVQISRIREKQKDEDFDLSRLHFFKETLASATEFFSRILRLTTRLEKWYAMKSQKSPNGRKQGSCEAGTAKHQRLYSQSKSLKRILGTQLAKSYKSCWSWGFRELLQEANYRWTKNQDKWYVWSCQQSVGSARIWCDSFNCTIHTAYSCFFRWTQLKVTFKLDAWRILFESVFLFPFSQISLSRVLGQRPSRRQMQLFTTRCGWCWGGGHGWDIAAVGLSTFFAWRRYVLTFIQMLHVSQAWEWQPFWRGTAKLRKPPGWVSEIKSQVKKMDDWYIGLMGMVQTSAQVADVECNAQHGQKTSKDNDLGWDVSIHWCLQAVVRVQPKSAVADALQIAGNQKLELRYLEIVSCWFFMILSDEKTFALSRILVCFSKGVVTLLG